MGNQNKLRIKGIGNLTIIGENPLPEKEYLVSIKCELEKIEKDIKEPKNPVFTFIMSYLSTELIQRIGDKQVIKVHKGKSQSQILRWYIEELAQAKGQSPEEFYQKEMTKVIESYKSQLDL